MKETISQSQFIQRFDDMNRGNNFSIKARETLFNYLERTEESIGEEIEFDVIALCVEYSEYKSIKGLNEDTGYDVESIKELREKTQVIEIEDNGFIVRNY